MPPHAAIALAIEDRRPWFRLPSIPSARRLASTRHSAKNPTKIPMPFCAQRQQTYFFGRDSNRPDIGSAKPPKSGLIRLMGFIWLRNGHFNPADGH